MKTMMIFAATSMLGWLSACGPASAADSAAGQKIFAAACAACHKLNVPPYAGKTEAQLETDMKSIVAGTIKHPKKITLSATDIADVATYISSNDSK